MSGSLCSRIVEDVIVCPAYIPAALRRLGLCARRRLEQFYVPVNLFYWLSNETVSGQLKAAQDMHSP